MAIWMLALTTIGSDHKACFPISPFYMAKLCSPFNRLSFMDSLSKVHWASLGANNPAENNGEDISN